MAFVEAVAKEHPDWPHERVAALVEEHPDWPFNKLGEYIRAHPVEHPPATHTNTKVSIQDAEEEGKGWKAFYISDKEGARVQGRMFLSPEPKNRIAVRLIQAMEEGKGYGTAMLDHAIEHARSQGKDIISDPEGGTKAAAASLFQKRGASKIKYDSPEGYVWLIKTKHKFYRPDQVRDESGKFEDEGGPSEKASARADCRKRPMTSQ